MKIVVCVKHAIDESELRADSAGRPLLQGAQSKMSTFDRNAVEEAVRVREAKTGTVTVVSVGSGDWKKTIKEALAMGCDRALAVNADRQLGAVETSYYLSRAVRHVGPVDLVIFAEGASDTYHGLVGPMTAEWLNLPFMGYVRRLELSDDQARCELALEEHDVTAEASLPAAISVVSEINSPRYPTLLQIMQASKKPMEEATLGSLEDGDLPLNRVQVLDVSVQSVSRKRMMFEGTPEEASRKLVEALKEEGVI